MNRTNDHTLKDVIAELLKTFRLSDKMNEMKISESWAKVVGKLIDKHTTRITLRNKKLYVTLDNAAIRSELHYAKDKLLKSLNKIVGKDGLDEIIFK